jgi:hypothetical protein
MPVRLLVILIFSIHAAGGLYAQAPVSSDFKVQSAAAKAQAQKMAQLLVAKKYAEFAAYVHPNIAKMSGGQAKMVAGLKDAMQGLEKQGMSITSVKIKDPISMLKTGTEFQAVIPQEFTLKVNTGTLQQTAYLIGISNDGGKKWTFIDTSNKTLDQIRQVIPSLSTKITIPEKTAPVHHTD